MELEPVVINKQIFLLKNSGGDWVQTGTGNKSTRAPRGLLRATHNCGLETEVLITAETRADIIRAGALARSRRG